LRGRRIFGPVLENEPDGSFSERGINLLWHDAILSTRKEAASNLGRFMVLRRTPLLLRHLDAQTPPHPQRTHRARPARAAPDRLTTPNEETTGVAPQDAT